MVGPTPPDGVATAAGVAVAAGAAPTRAVGTARTLDGDTAVAIGTAVPVDGCPMDGMVVILVDGSTEAAAVAGGRYVTDHTLIVFQMIITDIFPTLLNYKRI